MTQSRELLTIEPLPGYPVEIGRWLAALEDSRRRTMRILEDVDQFAIDWAAPGTADSIGTQLYHIAAIELDWLYVEVLEQGSSAMAAPLLPYDVRDAQGLLTAVRNESIATHFDRLAQARQRLLDAFRGITIEDFRRPRSLPSYDVTPEWVIQHLMQHEAEHRSQIEALREQADAAHR